MHIEGTYTLPAPPKYVWHGMRDQQMLLRAMPGMKQIEALDEYTFAISLTMSQEPFIGNYQSKLTISEQQFPHHYRIAIQGTNEHRQFRGEVSIHLQDRDESTIVSYSGTLHLDSSGEGISTNLARGAAKLLIQQFFSALNDQLQVNKALDDDFAAVIEYYDPYGIAGMKSENGVILKEDMSKHVATTPLQSPSMITTSEQRGVFYTLVHLLGLGHGEPEQEQIWTRRLRRTGTIASLVFLVWLGTRLPRPQVKLEYPLLSVDD
jgi:carbon monoxide dehydrogenase subunit G